MKARHKNRAFFASGSCEADVFLKEIIKTDGEKTVTFKRYNGHLLFFGRLRYF